MVGVQHDGNLYKNDFLIEWKERGSQVNLKSSDSLGCLNPHAALTVFLGRGFPWAREPAAWKAGQLGISKPMDHRKTKKTR